MIFVISREMQVEKLWAIRSTIVGYGETQMVLAQRATTILLQGDMPLREPCESIHAFSLESCGRFEMSRR
jgi:hypothetical protein